MLHLDLALIILNSRLSELHPAGVPNYPQLLPIGKSGFLEMEVLVVSMLSVHMTSHYNQGLRDSPCP